MKTQIYLRMHHSPTKFTCVALCWVRHWVGGMKLNVDGSFPGKDGRNGKSSEQNGSKDFMAAFRTTPPLKLRAVHRGLNLAMQEEINSIEIELIPQT